MTTSATRAFVRSFFSLLFLGPLFLSLTRCGSAVPPPVGAERCNGITCSGNNDCRVAGVVPVCAVGTSGTCTQPLPTRTCSWKLNINDGCPCIEHDIRLCNAPGGVPGVTICTATSATTTAWATCVACPSCSAS